MSDKQKHLEFIQVVVNRLANASRRLKHGPLSWFRRCSS